MKIRLELRLEFLLSSLPFIPFCFWFFTSSYTLDCDYAICLNFLTLTNSAVCEQLKKTLSSDSKALCDDLKSDGFRIFTRSNFNEGLFSAVVLEANSKRLVAHSFISSFSFAVNNTFKDQTPASYMTLQCRMQSSVRNEADKDNEDRHSPTKEERRGKKINWAVTGSARCDEWAQSSLRDFSFRMEISALYFNLWKLKNHSTLGSSTLCVSPCTAP